MLRVKAFLVCASCGLATACGGGQDLTAEQLSNVVNAGRPALQACYQQALDKTPTKDELRCEAVIHVEPNGQVSKVDLDLSENPALSDCIRGAIAGMRFPTAEASTHASLPLIFRPEDPS